MTHPSRELNEREEGHPELSASRQYACGVDGSTRSHLRRQVALGEEEGHGRSDPLNLEESPTVSDVIDSRV
jgi:hypothetical protein